MHLCPVTITITIFTVGNKTISNLFVINTITKEFINASNLLTRHSLVLHFKLAIAWLTTKPKLVIIIANAET